MEKRGVIEEGRTPPEKPQLPEKKAAVNDLAQHASTRLAEAAQQATSK